MQSTLSMLNDHRKIIFALMLRELATRYGRNNIGFLWVVGEPLVFCVAVLALWHLINGQYERGLELVPFLVTGYMPTILVRHMVMYSIAAVRANGSLLYHSHISVLDLLMARIVLEFIGVTLAFVLVYTILFIFGTVPVPYDLSYVYGGWAILALNAAGLALIVGSLSEIQEVVERVVGVTLYILVPVSGTFFIAEWLPESFRKYALLLPFLNCSEMIRLGFMGHVFTPYYNAGYATFIGASMVVIGLLLVRQVRERVEIG